MTSSFHTLDNRTRLSPYTRLKRGTSSRQKHLPSEVAGTPSDRPVVSSAELAHAAPARRPFAPQFDARRALLSRSPAEQAPAVPVSYSARRTESEPDDRPAVQTGIPSYAEERQQGAARTTLRLPDGVTARSR